MQPCQVASSDTFRRPSMLMLHLHNNNNNENTKYEHLQKLFDRNHTHSHTFRSPCTQTPAYNHRRNQIKWKYPDYARNKTRRFGRSCSFARTHTHTRASAYSSPRMPPRVFNAHVYIATEAVAVLLRLCHRRRRQRKREAFERPSSYRFEVHDAERIYPPICV